jgi:methyltransferase-like protein 6
MSEEEDTKDDSSSVVEEVIVSTEPCDPEDKEQLDELLKSQDKGKGVTEFWKDKYEKDAKKNWDIFYKRNTTNFFKDRHYLEREFPQLVEPVSQENPDVFVAKRMIEIGCGVGNALFPLIQRNPHIYGYGVDFSSKAIELVKENSSYDESRCKAWVRDISEPETEPPEDVASDPVDLGIMLFVLSAIHPEKMANAWNFASKCIKPGGYLFFRDYAVYDMAQLRLKNPSKLGDSLYVRGDGTRTYFFTRDEIASMAETAGFEVVESMYHRKKINNRKAGLEMRRVWIQTICRRKQ